MKKNETITVTIMTPFEIVWAGNAFSISASNSEGVFDVLPDHARFLTLIDEKPVVIHTENGESKTYFFSNAVLFFHDNSARIYMH
jgi:F0F1-type ATP synthase epsilon subunit